MSGEAPANFKAICAVSDDALAQQYLDAANGSLEDAINTYMAAVDAGAVAPAAAAAAAPRAAPRGGLVDMSSVRTQAGDDEGRQEYYAGGSSSGAAILDPTKKDTDIFKRLQAVLDNHFPERLHVGFVARAPRLFSGIYKLVEPFLAADTRAKAKICGKSDDHTAALSLLVPRANIPSFLGGDAADCTIPEGVLA